MEFEISYTSKEVTPKEECGSPASGSIQKPSTSHSHFLMRNLG